MTTFKASAAFYDQLRLLIPNLPDPSYVCELDIHVEPSQIPTITVMMRAKDDKYAVDPFTQTFEVSLKDGEG